MTLAKFTHRAPPRDQRRPREDDRAAADGAVAAVADRSARRRDRPPLAPDAAVRARCSPSSSPRIPAFRDYLTPERIDLLSSLAPLHDIGKVGVPDRMLNKPGALTPDELAEMRKHPALRPRRHRARRARVGVHDDAILAMAKDIVYTHHERWDGTGYPQGLRGTEIPIPGRLMAVVDVYDAAGPAASTSSRFARRGGRGHRLGGGTHFDPAVVDAFLAVAGELEQVSNTA